MRWDLVALVAGTLVLGLATTVADAGRLTLMLLALLIFCAPAMLDSTGWRVRLGLAWLAAEQRRRVRGFRVPRTAAGADRWLSQPENAEAGLVRASALLMAGRTAEARSLVASYPTTTPEDEARVARMLASIDGIERGRVDPTAAEAAIAALPAAEQPYHRLSLAWSIAWVDAAHGRPWRRAFAKASSGLPSGSIPLRFLLYQAFQELVLPIVGLVVIALFVVFDVL